MRRIHRKGAALFLTVAMIAILTPIVIYFSNTCRSRLRLAKTISSRTQALSLAKGGLFLALDTLGRDNRSYFFLPSDNPFKKTEETVQTDLDREYLWFAESAKSPKPFEGGSISVDISCCSSRISLNTGDIHLIAGAIQSAGITVDTTSEIFREEDEVDMSREMAAAIVDWRDKDENEYPAIGAETSWYSRRSPKMNSRNGYFESFAELSLLRYFEEIDIRSFVEKDLFTLAGTNGRVNANTASEVVLKALPGIYGTGLEDTLVRELIANRPYHSLNQVQGVATSVSSSVWEQAGKYFDISGKRFRITVKGTVQDVDATIRVVVEKRGSTFATISWKDY